MIVASRDGKKGGGHHTTPFIRTSGSLGGGRGFAPDLDEVPEGRRGTLERAIRVISGC